MAEEPFPTEVADLPEASERDVVELADGDRFELRIAPVAKQLGEDKVRMLAYNGSIPGPVLKVPEGSEIRLRQANRELAEEPDSEGPCYRYSKEVCGLAPSSHRGVPT